MRCVAPALNELCSVCNTINAIKSLQKAKVNCHAIKKSQKRLIGPYRRHKSFTSLSSIVPTFSKAFIFSQLASKTQSASRQTDKEKQTNQIQGGPK